MSFHFLGKLLQNRRGISSTVGLLCLVLILNVLGGCWSLADDPQVARDAAPPAGDASNHASLGLTPAEEAWVKAHPIIRVGVDPAWPPFSCRNHDGELVGMDLDFLHALGAKLGVKFVPISGRNWSEVYGKVRSNEVDMLAGVAKTPERADVVNFTDSYVDFPAAIVTRQDGPFMVGFANLEGHLVAAPRDYAPTLLLQSDYPRVQLVMTDTVHDALRMVSRGDAFATFDNLASANYIIKDEGLSNLKVAGITGYQFALRYGVRKDWPEFPAILQKALASISDRDREVIKDRWISLGVDELVASNRHQWSLSLAVGLIGAAVLLVLIWNHTLAREIARRKKAEAELSEARNKAVEASRMKSDFLANLSHEIRNPLNALLGYSELLRREITDKRQRKYTEAIDAGGRTLLGVINDVLDLSKVEAGRLELHPAPTALRSLLRETHSLFAQRAVEKGITFTQEVEDTVPPLLLLDELRLRQIIYNAVSNALKFTEKGTVRLKASFDIEGGRVLTIKVSDTGSGIAPEDRERIFEPFVQREGQSPELGGTGLGLAISKRLTEWMGGQIKLESTVGKGSTFSFIFPGITGVPLEAAKSVPKSGDLTDFKQLHVVVVDDMESNRELLTEYFQRAGHVVWSSEDAEQGIVLVKAHRPDFVLLDFRLPGMNGREAAQVLKNDPETAAIPIVFLSGSMRVALETSDLPGAIVLAKPLAYAELVRALRSLLPHALK